MKRLLIMLALIAFLASPVAAEQFTTAIERSGVDVALLTKLMQKGQLLLVEEDASGKLALVTAGILLNAPVDKVWNVVTDYAHYSEFMPSTAACEIVKDDGNVKDIRFKIQFKFSVLSWEVDYVARHEFDPKKEIKFDLVSSKGDKIKKTYGAWQFFDAGNGKTAAFYSVYSDIKNVSWVVRKAFEAEPSMEMSVAASAAVMVLKAIKSRVDDPTFAPNKK
jgi:coenzyme Q-binding protein COQ10